MADDASSYSSSSSSSRVYHQEAQESQDGNSNGINNDKNVLTEDDEFAGMPIRPALVWVPPPNQVKLTNQQKFEDVQRTLRWTDPNVACNEVKFVYKHFAHKRFPPSAESHLAVHFEMDGCSIFEDSEEARAQRLKQKKIDAEDLLESEGIVSTASALADSHTHSSASAIAGATGVVGASDTLHFHDSSKNEFNYSDRACQTSTVPVREIGITTIPPAMEQFSTTVNQWKIYDFFVKGLQQEKRESELLAHAHEGGAPPIPSTSRSSSRVSTASNRTSSSSRPPTAVRRPRSRAQSRGAGGVQEAEEIKRGVNNKSRPSKTDNQSHSDGSGGENGAKNNEMSREQLMRSPSMLRALQVLERIVNQNREDDIYSDFKYWEDDSDQFKEGGQGSLLPLWRFTSDRTKQKHVTCIAWHSTYHDLFAVSYGSYDFSRQAEGLVYCYSLKNTSYPQYMFNLECGAMCLDWHPQHHALLCVGCYDGTVMVYDVRIPGQIPIFKSTVRTGKHTDPVWQVHWQEEDVSKGLNFFSVSSDGLVSNWTLTNTELRMETLMRLEKMADMPTAAHEEAPSNSPSSSAMSMSSRPSSSSSVEESKQSKRGFGDSEDKKGVLTIPGLEAGVCVDFNRHSDHLFIVGTEEGHIHKCSKAYSGQYLQSYVGHDMTVYSLQWNPFHPQVFISCSCDWTVKIWRHDASEPQLTLSLGDTVGDVQWAPYSSTVFAAITNDGFVHVFDLDVNRHEPICKQKVVKRSKLTKLRFSLYDPIVVIGDENGAVTSLKLSPNLRKNMNPDNVYDNAAEKRRLDACLRIGVLLPS